MNNRRQFLEKGVKAGLYAVLVWLGLSAASVRTRDDFKARCPRDYYCLKKCPFKAISLDAEGYPAIERKKCVAWVEEARLFKWRKCGLCLRGCPTRALELVNS